MLENEIIMKQSHYFNFVSQYNIASRLGSSRQEIFLVLTNFQEERKFKAK